MSSVSAKAPWGAHPQGKRAAVTSPGLRQASFLASCGTKGLSSNERQLRGWLARGPDQSTLGRRLTVDLESNGKSWRAAQLRTIAPGPSGASAEDPRVRHTSCRAGAAPEPQFEPAHGPCIKSSLGGKGPSRDQLRTKFKCLSHRRMRVPSPSGMQEPYRRVGAASRSGERGGLIGPWSGPAVASMIVPRAVRQGHRIGQDAEHRDRGANLPEPHADS